MFAIRIFLKKILCLPHFLYLVLLDLIKYIKNQGWKQFNGFGLHIYVGKFGAGKTSAMVRRAYNLSRRYPQLTIITNVTLKNFPKHTKILPLHTPQDIINAPCQSLVLIAEIGTIFNNRDFASNKNSVPKPLYQQICQNRHKNIMIIADCQYYEQYDKQLRQITATVTECSTGFTHPFSRLCTLRTYDRQEYDKSFNNPNVEIMPIDFDVFVQTDKLRNLYDTNELVNSMLSAEYISDEEILKNQSGPGDNIIVIENKKKKKRLI